MGSTQITDKSNLFTDITANTALESDICTWSRESVTRILNALRITGTINASASHSIFKALRISEAFMDSRPFNAAAQSPALP